MSQHVNMMSCVGAHMQQKEAGFGAAAAESLSLRLKKHEAHSRDGCISLRRLHKAGFKLNHMVRIKMKPDYGTGLFA
ncbi:MAG: hypothetical protein AB7G25_10465 [Sphingomonadaceae bacterium]